MTTNLDKVKHRVAALLALAASTHAEAEATTARERARALAGRYGLQLSECALRTDGSGEAIQRRFPIDGALWRLFLADKVATYTHCQVIRGRTPGQRGAVLYVMGIAGDIERWHELYTRAENEIHREGAAYAVGRGRSAGDTWRKGAVAGYGKRLAELRKAAEASVQGRANADALRHASPSTGTALVMVGRELAVNALKKRLHPRTKGVGMRAGGTSGDYQRGYKHGEGMGAHRGHLGGGR